MSDSRYHLIDLRRHTGRTQDQVAEALGTTQSAVSRIERQSDLLLSTFVRYAEATGGRVRVLVDYPDGTFELNTREIW